MTRTRVKRVGRGGLGSGTRLGKGRDSKLTSLNRDPHVNRDTTGSITFTPISWRVVAGIKL